jgi:RNA polymerase sigma factor for flagellar operon FliA
MRMTIAPEHDLDTRDRLVMEHVGLVKLLASRLSHRLPSQVEFSELVSVGVLGLIDAAGRYRASLVCPRRVRRRRIQGHARSLRGSTGRRARPAAAQVDGRWRSCGKLKREPETEIAAALNVSEPNNKMLDKRRGELATIRQASSTPTARRSTSRSTRRRVARPERSPDARPWPPPCGFPSGAPHSALCRKS